MLQSVTMFVPYFESIRRRTVTYIRCLPPDQLDWKPKPGEFSCADLIRHIAAAETMFVGAVAESVWRYSGHTASHPTTLDTLLADLEQSHVRAMATLRQVPDHDLRQPRPTLDGPPVKAWRLLMALVEHEVHHRSQLAMYLMLLDVQPPHIYVLGVEDVIARATA
ncbi:MAG TPA: DinB family protein [Herpetosiphonaceae bacterium]